MELIDRKALVKDHGDDILNWGAPHAVLLTSIAAAPTIDAAPVVHGRWVYPLGLAWSYVCSECGGSGGVVGTPYCPSCGAKMDGDDGVPKTLLLVEDKSTKSKLAEILGVFVGERFRIPGRPMEMSVDGDKAVNWHMDDYTHPVGDFELLLDLIADPSIIIRKPRFTADELAMLRCFAEAGVTAIVREPDESLKWEYDCKIGDTCWLPWNMLQSIRPGQSVGLAEVLK